LATYGDDLTLRRLLIWQMGSFELLELKFSVLFFILTCLILYLFYRPIHYLYFFFLGHNKMLNLGIDAIHLRNLFLSLVGISTALVVSICGPIAFVGTIAPHISRFILEGEGHDISPKRHFFETIYAAIFMIVSIECLRICYFSLIGPNTLLGIIFAPAILWVFQAHSRGRVAEKRGIKNKSSYKEKS